MGMADELFDGLAGITRYQREAPEAYSCMSDEIEVVKLAMDALKAKLDCFEDRNLDPRSRAVLALLVEHLKPLIPAEGVFVPMADDSDEDGVVSDQQMEGRVHARISADLERERQAQPLPTIDPESFEDRRHIEL